MICYYDMLVKNIFYSMGRLLHIGMCFGDRFLISENHFLIFPVKDLPQGFGKKRNIFPTAGEAHQPYPPDLPFQRSESTGDVDVIGFA